MSIRRPSLRNLTAAQRSDLVEMVQRGELDPDQAKYIARHEVLCKMPPEFVSSLAGLANIPNAPPQRCQWFQRAIHNIIREAWDRQENLDGLAALTKQRAYADLIKKLKSIKRALAQLGNTDRGLLGFPIAEIESGIDRFLEMVGADSPPRRPYRRGRPKGNVKNASFQKFVWDLLEVTWEANGNLSLEKNIGEGSLIKAIKMLSQYLPSDLVPQNLPASTLQRIKTDFQKQLEDRRRPQ